MIDAPERIDNSSMKGSYQLARKKTNNSTEKNRKEYGF